MRLTRYINKIEAYAPHHEATNTKVSKSTIGWQLAHSLKAMNVVIDLIKTAPTDKKPKITNFGRFCLFARYIPRGKGKAPKGVLPPENIDLEVLDQQIKTAKKLVKDLEGVSDKATFKHPYFGILTKSQTIRFIEVHTNHHLKIVRDILKAENINIQ